MMQGAHQQQAPRAITLVFVYLFLLGAVSAIECSGGPSPFVITTQSDADSLQECIDVDLSAREQRKIGYQGNVVISPLASGTINLTWYDYVNGSLLAENAPSLQQLYLLPSPDQWATAGFQAVTVKNLSGLTTFGYSTFHRGTVTVLRDLPRLEELILAGFGFNQPTDLELVNLPRIREILPRDFGATNVARNLTIRNVGLLSVNRFLSAGTGMGGSKYTIEEIPYVQQLATRAYPGTDLHLTGNENVSVVFNCSHCIGGSSSGFQFDFTYLPNLTLSGISSLSRTRAGPGSFNNLRLSALRVANSPRLAVLPLDVEDLSDLTVEYNSGLEAIRLNSSAANFSWSGISIRGNDALRMKSAISDGSPSALQSTFFWPNRNVSSMVFDGDFDDEFFQPFIDRGKDPSKRPIVLSKFVVWSRSEFGFTNCSALNELRRAGVLKGEYFCNGKTVPDESGARDILGRGLVHVLLWAATGWLLFGLVAGLGT